MTYSATRSNYENIATFNLMRSVKDVKLSFVA